MAPLASIIVTCYNQESFLEETLSSVCSQTFRDYECIIVDDGSTDGSSLIARKFCNQDKRFKLIKQENGGVSHARNTGLNAARGEFVNFLDGDDLLHPQKLEKSMAFRDTHDVIICDYEIFDSNGDRGRMCGDYRGIQINFFNILMQWDMVFSVPIHCILFRKMYSGSFLTGLNTREDWLFWLQLLQKTEKTIVLDDKLACYRLHENNITRNKAEMARGELAACQIAYEMADPEAAKLFFFSRLANKSEQLAHMSSQYDYLQKILNTRRHTMIENLYRTVKKILPRQ